MKFGRLDDISEVDFSLPPDHPDTAAVLKKSFSPLIDPFVYVGCSVWVDKGYANKVYPPGARQADQLYHYARQFNTVETNATHYKIPTPETVARWKNAVPDNFRFSPKYPQFISHRRSLVDNPEGIDRFLDVMSGLETTLGISFLQLPPFFGVDRMDNLRDFLEYIPGDFRTAIEFRHPSWFVDTVAFDEAFNMLKSYGASVVISDVAGRRDVLHQRLTSATALIRFNGHNLHPTDYLRADAWVARIAQWIEQGLKEIYLFTHEPERHLNADLALYFINKLNAACQLNLKPPKLYSAGVQQSLFS